MQKKHLYARVDIDDYDWLAEMANKSEPKTSISKYAEQCIKWRRTYKNLIAEMKEAKNEKRSSIHPSHLERSRLQS